MSLNSARRGREAGKDPHYKVGVGGGAGRIRSELGKQEPLNKRYGLGALAYTCDDSTPVAEAGGLI